MTLQADVLRAEARLVRAFRLIDASGEKVRAIFDQARFDASLELGKVDEWQLRAFAAEMVRLGLLKACLEWQRENVDEDHAAT